MFNEFLILLKKIKLGFLTLIFIKNTNPLYFIMDDPWGENFWGLEFGTGLVFCTGNKNIEDIVKIYNREISWLNTIQSFIISFIIIIFVLLLVAYAILAERKVLGSIQKRRGPNLVGIFGLLQPIADALKLIVKETIIPALSNKIIFIIAPLLTLILSLLNWSIIPFSNHAVLADVRISILMFFALSSLTVYGIIMSGWSSNSKYAFLGALRAAAQVIAYEVSIGLTLIYILIQTSDLNYYKIIVSQIEIWNIIPCFIFFILFFISTLAETNRPPFDLPEAEAELVSGYNVEYSAMSFGFFFLGEYVSIWTVCCLNIILFWGGFLTIFDYESIFLYSLKVIALVVTFIWVRGSLPRYRYDQLMRLGWKILLPISLGFVILYTGIYYKLVLSNLLLMTNLDEFNNFSNRLDMYFDLSVAEAFIAELDKQFFESLLGNAPDPENIIENYLMLKFNEVITEFFEIANKEIINIPNEDPFFKEELDKQFGKIFEITKFHNKIARLEKQIAVLLYDTDPFSEELEKQFTEFMGVHSLSLNNEIDFIKQGLADKLPGLKALLEEYDKVFQELFEIHKENLPNNFIKEFNNKIAECYKIDRLNNEIDRLNNEINRLNNEIQQIIDEIDRLNNEIEQIIDVCLNNEIQQIIDVWLNNEIKQIIDVCLNNEIEQIIDVCLNNEIPQIIDVWLNNEIQQIIDVCLNNEIPQIIDVWLNNEIEQIINVWLNNEIQQIIDVWLNNEIKQIINVCLNNEIPQIIDVWLNNEIQQIIDVCLNNEIPQIIDVWLNNEIEQIINVWLNNEIDMLKKELSDNWHNVKPLMEEFDKEIIKFLEMDKFFKEIDNLYNVFNTEPFSEELEKQFTEILEIANIKKELLNNLVIEKTIKEELDKQIEEIIKIINSRLN